MGQEGEREGELSMLIFAEVSSRGIYIIASGWVTVVDDP